MIAQAIESVAVLAKIAEQKKIQVFDRPGSRHQKYVLRPDGVIDLVDAETPPVAHAFHSLESFIGFVKTQTAPRVFVDSTQVTAILDVSAHRENVVRCKLSLTEEYALLARWAADKEEPTWYEPRGLLRVVSTKMCDCLGLAPGLLSALKEVKFDTGATRTSNVRTGDANYGIDVRNSTKVGTESLEKFEITKFSILVFNDPFFKNRFAVRCRFEDDADQGFLSITPVSTDLENCLTDARETLRAQLEEAIGFPAFVGSP